MPLSLEDQFEIMRLMARYNHAADSGNAAGFADTFTEVGLFEGSMNSARGRAELIEVMSGIPPSARSRHWNNNILIEGDGDDATARCYLMRVSTASPHQVIASGMYHDTLKRVNGQWKFSHRKVHPDPRKD